MNGVDRAALLACIAALATLAGPAAADRAGRPGSAADRTDAGGGVVLVNATSKRGDIGTYEKLRRVLDANDLLIKLAPPMQQLMDGRRLAIEDLASIRDAYVRMEYDTALGIVDQNERRVVANAASGDPLPPLAALQLWRGLIALGQEEDPKALEYFRAAHRFDPTVLPDPAFRRAPTVQKLLRSAAEPVKTTGKLKIELASAATVVTIDGGKPQDVSQRLSLATGLHVVIITERGMKPYLEIVNILPGQLERIAPELEPETMDDRAARLVDATVTAPPGRARLRSADEVARLIGRKRFLYIEDMADGRMTIRVYDVATARVSKTVDLDLTVSESAIRRKLIAAVSPENMLDTTRVVLVEQPAASKAWYERWYVWVGAAAVLGGGALGYHYMTQEPMFVSGPN